MRSLPFVALGAMFAVASANADTLSFDAALKLAIKNAPSLQSKTAEVTAARSLARAAGRLPDPKLRIGVENFPISGPPAGSFTADSMTMATVGVMQDMPNNAKRKAERQRAVADIDFAAANAAVEIRDVRLNTALAWVDLYYAEQKLATLDTVQETITAIGATAPTQLAAGAIRPAQSLEAERMNAELADRRADLVADVARARAELVRWTGDETADIAGAPPPFHVNSRPNTAKIHHNT